MAVSLTKREADEGNAGTLTTTASENSVTVSHVTELYVHIDHNNGGTFGRDPSNQAVLPGQQWVKVWNRSGRNGEKGVTLFFASDSGTPTLSYRVVK